MRLSVSIDPKQSLTLHRLIDNVKRYGVALSTPAQSTHRRTQSQSHPPEPSLNNPELNSINRPPVSPSLEMDVFPPLRSRISDPSSFIPYMLEDTVYEEEYEDYLLDLSQEDQPGEPPFPGFWSQDSSGALASAWHRVETLAGGLADDISDSESVVSIGDLGEEVRPGEGGSDTESESGSELGHLEDSNVNNWEHMSPKTLKALSQSPSGARRSSSGASGNLRPVIPFGLDEGSALEEDSDENATMGNELGPMPTGRTAPFAAGEGGKGVDEVEVSLIIFCRSCYC